MKVHYFGIYGKAEQLRMLLAHAKQPFENVNFTFDSWPAEKFSGKYEFNQLPGLEIDGTILAQSGACMQLLGKKFGYVYSDPMQQYLVDSAMATIDDLTPQFYAPVMMQKDPELKEKNFKTFLGLLKNWFEKIQARFVKNGKTFLVGDKISIADFTIGSFVFATVHNDQFAYQKEFLQVLNDFPQLQTYFKNIGDEFKEYFASRPKCPM